MGTERLLDLNKPVKENCILEKVIKETAPTRLEGAVVFWLLP